jgi:hypothetical protein
MDSLKLFTKGIHTNRFVHENLQISLEQGILADCLVQENIQTVLHREYLKLFCTGDN